MTIHGEARATTLLCHSSRFCRRRLRGTASARRPRRRAFVQTASRVSARSSPTGTLAGVVAPYQNVAIQSSLTEPADAVYVREGDPVHAGQLLAQLDTVRSAGTAAIGSRDRE